MTKRMSALTRASQTRLSKSMSIGDLKTMCDLYKKVLEGNATIEEYRVKEQEIINKCGFYIQ